MDLGRLTEDGAFRRDLFFRLNVFPIDIPPLRGRREDIPAFVEIFLERLRQFHQKDISGVHPAVLEAAVTAMPDSKWGETPCAFVTLREGITDLNENDIIEFCRSSMAHFKAPRKVVFGSLPKTSTGKIQKFVLRERARELDG